MYWARLHRGPSTCFAVSGLRVCSGCYAPRNLLCGPCSIRPFGTVCAAALDLENGAIWPLNGLRAKKKFHVFRIKGLDTDPWGGRVNARNEKPVCQDGFFSGLAELELCLTG